MFSNGCLSIKQLLSRGPKRNVFLTALLWRSVIRESGQTDALSEASAAIFNPQVGCSDVIFTMLLI